MKKLLILTILFNFVLSQVYEDVVILKNGSEIHGIIIEQKPNEYIKIQSGENIFVYQMSEIELLRKELRSAGAESDIRNIYLTIGSGFITNKNINIGHLTLDLGFTKNISLFIAGGFPTIIGGGFCFQQDRSGSGLNFTVGTGFNMVAEGIDIIGTLGYQVRIPNSKAFGIFGIAGGVVGIDYYAEPYIWPVLSFEYRL